jgi:phosphatidylglycerol:prolipoprotein diacylglycerol transferase
MFAIPFPTIDPVLISIGPLSIRWYALAYIAGIILGWRYILHLTQRPALWPQNAPVLEAKQTEDLLTWMTLGIVLGGRLGFVLFYQPEYYLSHPIDILKVWQGGMSFHGGFLGVVVATYLFSRQYKCRFWSLMDVIACAAPIGLLFGRIANFINGELWGRETTVPWGVIFPGQHAGGLVRHPSQLYEAVLEGALLFIILYGMAMYRNALKFPRLCCGIFLTGYGLSRILVETVREPDAFIGFLAEFDGYGITMGMLLSTPMVLLGIYLIMMAKRTSTP